MRDQSRLAKTGRRQGLKPIGCLNLSVGGKYLPTHGSHYMLPCRTILSNRPKRKIAPGGGTSVTNKKDKITRPINDSENDFLLSQHSN